LILEQQQYDPVEQAGLAEEYRANLNTDQQAAFERITSAIADRTEETFFLHGPGGTGKTYLYNMLCYQLHSEQKIVLCIAPSGIAALLLKGGCTAHSCFKIPIPCYESSICSIIKNSEQADLICITDLVIWDKAPMRHRHVIETVDRTFRDLCNSPNAPFDGITFVFGRDFKQILPVIISGSRAQIVGACLQRSVLWRSITVLHLNQNMCLNTAIEAEKDFAKWQLDVGKRMHTDNDSNVLLPPSFHCRENTVASLIETIYPGVTRPNLSAVYFAEWTILCYLNEDVDKMNHKVLQEFPGQSQVLYSADSIPTSELSGEDDSNEINCSRMPLAKLEIKIGDPIMVLKNLDAAHRLCNRSRGILTRCRNRVLEVELITGSHAGQKCRTHCVCARVAVFAHMCLCLFCFLYSTLLITV
jgi:ATP-dependent DNA helicase PIF1